MLDRMFPVLLTVVLISWAGVSFTLLLRPSLFLRRFPNPLQPDTPWNRIQMRGLGLVFSLFTLYPLLMLSASSPESSWHYLFRHNVLIALWASFFTVPILLWTIWRFFARSAIRRLQIEGLCEDPAWERQMTRVFCTVLFSVIALALFFAVKGHHF